MRVTSMIEEMAAKSISSYKKENDDGGKPKNRKYEKSISSLSGLRICGDTGIGPSSVGKTGIYERKADIEPDPPGKDDTTQTIDG